MRALLVVNPNATATSARTREVLASALGADNRVDVAWTKSRGHAIELGAQAVEERYELVVALGGDGTVNEVVNGLMTSGPSADLPIFAAVPVGSTNVFTRALGYSTDPVEATGELLDALRDGRTRLITLGHSTLRRSTPGHSSPEERWFTFNAGLGLDAEVVRHVDDRRAHGRKASVSRYVRSAVNRYYFGTDRRHPALTLTGPDIPEETRLGLALICNVDPWTYFGSRPVRPCPEATFEEGLDLFGITRLRTASSLRHVAQFFTRNPDPRGRRVVRLHDAREFTLTADQPQPFQVDGEPLGDWNEVTLRAVPAALEVVA
jgi:diacylglycerol kinase family enzyme